MNEKEKKDYLERIRKPKKKVFPFSRISFSRTWWYRC